MKGPPRDTNWSQQSPDPAKIPEARQHQLRSIYHKASILVCA
jgi:hypothetical protein